MTLNKREGEKIINKTPAYPGHEIENKESVFEEEVLYFDRNLLVKAAESTPDQIPHALPASEVPGYSVTSGLSSSSVTSDFPRIKFCLRTGRG